MRRLFVMASIMACLANDALADQTDFLLAHMLGTIQVQSEPRMVGGKLSGCQYVFTAVTQDWVYRKGQYLKVDGSVGLMLINGTLGSTLKVVVNEISIDRQGVLLFTPAPPSRSYLLGADYSTNLNGLVQAGASDTPGALFSVFSIGSTLKLLTEAVDTKKITIAFNRAEGSSDILLPIELDVKSIQDDGRKIRSDETAINFASCILALLKNEK